jgi:hypothetical protein
MYSSFLSSDKAGFVSSVASKPVRIGGFFFFLHVSAALVGQVIFYEFHRSNSDTPQSVGLLWMIDLSVAETNNTHNRETSMNLTGFETEIPASEGTYDHALDRAATETGSRRFLAHGNAAVVLKLNPHLH